MSHAGGAGDAEDEAPIETLELVIDQGRYFAFHVNDLLALQSQPTARAAPASEACSPSMVFA